MPLLGIIGGLTLLALAATWGTVRLVTLSLQSQSNTPLHYVQRVWQTFGTAVGVLVLLETWPGLAHWTSTAFEVVA